MQKATRQQTKDHNSRLVYKSIYDGQGISRADIARATGLTKTTVSNIVVDLIGEGLVEESGYGTSGEENHPSCCALWTRPGTIWASTWRTASSVGRR